MIDFFDLLDPLDGNDRNDKTDKDKNKQNKNNKEDKTSSSLFSLKGSLLQWLIVIGAVGFALYQMFDDKDLSTIDKSDIIEYLPWIIVLVVPFIEDYVLKFLGIEHWATENNIAMIAYYAIEIIVMGILFMLIKFGIEFFFGIKLPLNESFDFDNGFLMMIGAILFFKFMSKLEPK